MSYTMTAVLSECSRVHSPTSRGLRDPDTRSQDVMVSSVAQRGMLPTHSLHSSGRLRLMPSRPDGAEAARFWSARAR